MKVSPVRVGVKARARSSTKQKDMSRRRISYTKGDSKMADTTVTKIRRVTSYNTPEKTLTHTHSLPACGRHELGLTLTPELSQLNPDFHPRYGVTVLGEL